MEFDINLDTLDITPRVGPGRQPKPLEAEFVRPLTAADLATPATAIQQPAPLKRIRDSHHALARVLASGESEGVASAITGFSPSRISILKADPQFQQLLEFYRGKSQDIFADMQARMATLGLDAMEELRQRLEEAPETFTVSQLRELLRDMADRVGHAPKTGPSTVNNIQVNLGEAMARARARAEQVRLPRVIDNE